MKKFASIMLLVFVAVQSAFAGGTCLENPARIAEFLQYEQTFLDQQLQHHGAVEVPQKLLTAVRRLQASSPKLAGMDVRVVGIGDAGVSAFAGYSTIILSAGLWNPDAGLTEGEAVAVVAHELSHVEAKHALAWACMTIERFGQPELTFAQAMTAFAAAVVASPDELFPAVKKEKQANEFYADKRGTELLQVAGFDPQAMVSFMMKMHALDIVNGTALEETTTHPSSLERAIAAQAAILSRVSVASLVAP